MVRDVPHPSFPSCSSSMLQQLPLIPFQFVIRPVLRAGEERLLIPLPAFYITYAL